MLVLNRFFILIATGLGAGFSPIVPGTMGTLVAIPFYYFVSSIPPPVYELTLLAFFFFSSWISNQAERYWGKKDDRRIVIDEIMGFLVTMLWIPRSPLFMVVGFILFRFFDILKPFPIRRLERVRSGYGVVLDDVLAGIYSNIALHLVMAVLRY
ncbi:MAG TPA: phosphatidylglycerophosphatase A [Thermodesulfobacteriota bacterium]|nr:phosphatidylglycerophosphatase A [Thermodesulfobacteriota bacterium]